MKHLRKLALATAVSAVAAGAHADLQLLDDESMQSVSGQAGLTIDVESRWEIGEFAYKDAGFLVLQGLRMGGHDLHNDTSSQYYLDNLRLEIDIAGDGIATPGDNELHYGFSSMRDYAQYYVDAGNTADPVEFAGAANGIDSVRGLTIDDKKVYGDGDLVIHFDITDPWANEGGFQAASAPGGLFETQTYADFEAMTEHAVDFRFEIDAIGLAASDYVVGSKGLDIDGNHTSGLHEGQAGTTTLISQLSMQGYLGPEDLHISNNGNGFGDTNNNGIEDAGEVFGIGDANSKITWGSYFKVTDMDVYIDIVGVQIQDMAIHNERGDLSGLDGTSSFNFAHSIREIYAVKDAVFQSGQLVDGIAINTRFKGDMDIKHLSFGDTGTSIGELYWTDIESDTRWIISAH